MAALTDLQRRLRRRAARAIQPKADRRPPGVQAFYAQQESCQVPDLWFLYAKFLGERTDGSFVEVGAYDGVFVSNTWGLAAQGWRGLMIEPVPRLAEACRRSHRHHPAVRVLECAIGPDGVSDVSLVLAGTLTSANADVVAEYSGVDWATRHVSDTRITVPCMTLDRALASEAIEVGFDVLVVDVEGFEVEVFSGFDIARWAPKMMIVELADVHPDLDSTSIKDAQLGSRLASSGYRIVFKDRVNTVFVRHDVWERAYSG